MTRVLFASLLGVLAVLPSAAPSTAREAVPVPGRDVVELVGDGIRREHRETQAFVARGPQGASPDPELPDGSSLDAVVGADPVAARGLSAPLRAVVAPPTRPRTIESGPGSQISTGVEADTAAGASVRPCRPGLTHTAREKAILAGAFVAGLAGLGVLFGLQRSQRY